MGGISKNCSKNHHKLTKKQTKDNIVEDSYHNTDSIPCLSLKGWIDDLLLPFLGNAKDAACSFSIPNGSSHTKKGAQGVKKGDSPSCLITLLWRCWLEEQKKGQEQLSSEQQGNNAAAVPAESKKKKRKTKKKQDDTSAIEINAATDRNTSNNQSSIIVTGSSNMVYDRVTAAITSLYPCRTLQEFFRSSHVLHIPLSEMEDYIQMQLESITCPECLVQAKTQFLSFSEFDKIATNHNSDNHTNNSKNGLSLMDPFRMKPDEENTSDNDLSLASMEEGIPLQPQQSQLYLSIRSNTTSNMSNEERAKESSKNKYLLLHGVTAPSNNSSCDDDNIKIWMEWIFSLLIPLVKSTTTCGSVKDGGTIVLTTSDKHYQPPVEHFLEQLLQNDIPASNIDKAFLDQLLQRDMALCSQIFISPRHLQMMVRIRDIRTRIFTNINWKQNESRLQSSTHHTTNSQCINYRQKSHLDGIDQDLYTWLEEMTTLLLLITVDNSTNNTKLLDQLWDSYEQQLDVVLRASVKYRSEQLFSSTNNNHNANLPLLWNNEQLRHFMEEKQSCQLDALQKIHIALEHAVTSSSKNESRSASMSSTSHFPKEDLLLQRIFLSRASIAMRTIVKGTKEEIRKEQQEKNGELVNTIKEEFLLKLTEKKTFVVSKVIKFLSTIALPESQRDLVMEWKSKFLNSWEALDRKAEEARLTLEKHLQKVVREQSQQQRSAALSESTQENEANIRTCNNSTEKKGFLCKTVEIFRYSGQLATLSFQKWRLFSMFVSRSHQLEQHFSVSTKQLMSTQSCTGGGTHGGRRRLVAMASVFVLRWLELKCTEWNVEESQRELLERIIAEEQHLVADESTAATKADKKKKKKKKTDSGARNCSSEGCNEHPNDGDNHKDATVVSKILNHEPSGYSVPLENLPAPTQQNTDVEASASTHISGFTSFPVDGDTLLISEKKNDPRAFNCDLRIAVDNDKVAAMTQNLHNQGFVHANIPACERVTPFPCFDDVYVTKHPQENGSVTAIPFTVIGREAPVVEEASLFFSVTRLFDTTSVQMFLEERMKALLAHGKEYEDAPSKIVYL